MIIIPSARSLTWNLASAWVLVSATAIEWPHQVDRLLLSLFGDSQNFKAPPPMRGFFFAGRAARHQPASLLRARLKFATVAGLSPSGASEICNHATRHR